ncbi:AfsR/SARP family transcriptional regulator [Nocardioides plantarum]|uniref:BTAD domain-containing putative transcriptional regulator n=1 Tax=Nocardioides plantarum TaxID=29299 RepID=A0ABV5KD55_9ACTN|nr:BTAD domain-containing putative transcriptional regulator [Nocardioides plantarum]
MSTPAVAPTIHPTSHEGCPGTTTTAHELDAARSLLDTPGQAPGDGVVLHLRPASRWTWWPETGSDHLRAQADPVPVTVLPGPASERGVTPPTLSIVGGFQLGFRGQPVRVSHMVQRLLVLLACHGPHLDRSQVAGTLWPEVTEARSRGNLRTVAYRLQQRAPGLLVNEGQTMSLHPELRVDMDDVTVLARILVEDPSEERVQVIDMQRYLLDDVLPAWDEDWLDGVRFRYRQMRLAALECLAVRLSVMRRYVQAMDAALAAVHADPLRESAHEAVIVVCLAQGNRNDALRHFRGYRSRLRDELGLDPSPRIESLLWEAV